MMRFLKMDKGQTPSMDHSAWWGAEGKTEEYYIDLAVGEVTWVWFTRTGMCNLRGRGRGRVEK